MGQITRGLGKIEIGTIAVDGGVATSWTKLGDTDRDSTASITEADPTREELYALEYDTPADVDLTAGAETWEWSVLNPDLATLALLWGGTVTGSGGTAKWSKSGTSVALEKSLRLTPRKGYVITVVRASLVPKIDYDLTKQGKLKVSIVATVLQPTKEDVDPVEFGPIV